MDIIRKDIPDSLVKKIIHTKDTIEKERKDVTVIFADISGFTTMSEALDPEELTLLMNECFRKLGAMVYRYEGIIDKFIGDCIMAIFGAPVTHEDDPERAILACLDMQNALKEINNSLDPSFKKLTIHSGVNTGVVIAGKVGSDLQMDYTVMGDTVNVAQRLKDISPQGGILAGKETYNRSRHAFDYLPHEPVQLKGKKEKVKPYEVVGRKWGSEFGLGAVHSDMVGRDQELDQLKQGYEDLKKEKTSVFVIKGEIGVGKSRLLYEFKKYLTMSAPDIALIDSRGVSYESSIPLKSFADSLRHFLAALHKKLYLRLHQVWVLTLRWEQRFRDGLWLGDHHDRYLDGGLWLRPPAVPVWPAGVDLLLDLHLYYVPSPDQPVGAVPDLGEVQPL